MVNQSELRTVMAKRADVIRTALDVAQSNGIPPAIMFWLIYHESRFDPNAASTRSTARGLGQLLASTWQQYGQGNIFNARDNAQTVCRVLKAWLGVCGGNWQCALARYAGQSTDGEFVSFVWTNAQQLGVPGGMVQTKPLEKLPGKSSKADQYLMWFAVALLFVRVVRR